MIIFARKSNVVINNSKVNDNFADKSILCFVKAQVYLRGLILSDNTGYFSVVHLLKTGAQVIDGLHFSHNLGSFLTMSSLARFTGSNLLNNSTQRYILESKSHLQAGGTLTVIRSRIEFQGNTIILENYSQKSGGALYASQSQVTIYSW